MSFDEKWIIVGVSFSLEYFIEMFVAANARGLKTCCSLDQGSGVKSQSVDMW
jgi:hypothetical protein